MSDRSGKRVYGTKVKVSAGRTKTLLIKAVGSARRSLRRRARISFSVSLAGSGTTRTSSGRVTVRRR